MAIGADTTTYLEADNPAQRRILAFCARMSDDDAATWPIGVDGCGIPVYATGLRNGALSFARLASLTGIAPEDAKALRVVRDAMIAYPQYVAGTGQFDTVLMEAGRGEILSKGGAEGVHAVAAIAAGIGFVSQSARRRGPGSRPRLRSRPCAGSTSSMHRKNGSSRDLRGRRCIIGREMSWERS